MVFAIFTVPTWMVVFLMVNVGKYCKHEVLVIFFVFFPRGEFRNATNWMNYDFAKGWKVVGETSTKDFFGNFYPENCGEMK